MPIRVDTLRRPDGTEIYSPIDPATERLALVGITIFLGSRSRAESRAKLRKKLQGREPITFQDKPSGSQ